MNSGDHATHAVLRALDAAVPDVQMSTPVERVLATARSRKRRRGAAAAAACAVAVGTGLVLGLTSVSPFAHGGHSVATGTVRLAAWTVDSSPDGTVTITTREFTHADLLQQVLARDGVPAVVRFGPQCQPAPGEHALPGPVQAKVIRPGKQPGGNPLTVDRNAMPSGTELLINHWRAGWDGAGWLGVTTVRLYPAGTTFACHAPPGNG
jgi:hypothetical protein